MALAPRFGSLQDSEIVRQARENLEATRDPQTNAIDDDALIAEIERIMPFNAGVERHKKAKRLKQTAERPGKTPSNGSLWLPGFEPRNWEPEQLIPDGEGKIVERDRATSHFISASLQRKAENLRRAEDAYRFEQAEANGYDEWVIDETLKGRPANEITMGNFLREKGYWRPDPIDPIVDEGAVELELE